MFFCQRPKLPYFFSFRLEEEEPFFQESENFFKWSFNQIIKNIDKYIYLRQSFSKLSSNSYNWRKEKVHNGRQEALTGKNCITVGGLINSVGQKRNNCQKENENCLRSDTKFKLI